MPPFRTPLPPSTKNFNWAGVVGFFGGQEVISAMLTMHYYEGRRWLGWFNSPGGLTVARYFGMTAKSRLWDALFPGPNDPPVVMFGLDGKRGPKYVGALSGTIMETGHFGYLTMERSRHIHERTDIIEGRETVPTNITYLAMKPVDYDLPAERLSLKYALWGLIPTIVNLATCAMCALVYDWVSFSIILFGIAISGLTHCIIGNRRLIIKSMNEPPRGAPPGHGVLMGENEVVVIKGKERDVITITKGCFAIEHGKQKPRDDEDHDTASAYHKFGLCSLLLAAQFLAQLFVVSQGTPFGQIMFTTSLFTSWLYCTYLSSLEREKIHSYLLFQWLGRPEMRRFQAGTRTTTTVFVCLLLFHGVEHSSRESDRERRVKALHSLVPNDTHVWMLWRERVVEQILSIDEPGLRYLEVDEEDQEFQVLSETGRDLLKVLLDDARDAIHKYLSIRDGLPADSTSVH